ncbi:hypothetical protein GGS26DRAFT_435459 [Hypomontagnella submonticulosa]|nr:hypothetical protein GGS26DRAFT_435459 [Hypomontagnella submonticulosa]
MVRGVSGLVGRASIYITRRKKGLLGLFFFIALLAFCFAVSSFSKSKLGGQLQGAHTDSMVTIYLPVDCLIFFTIYLFFFFFFFCY